MAAPKSPRGHYIISLAMACCLLLYPGLLLFFLLAPGRHVCRIYYLV